MNIKHNIGNLLDEYLSGGEVQRVLGISRNTLYRLLSTGELSGFRVGRQWRISRSSLEAFCKQKK